MDQEIKFNGYLTFEDSIIVQKAIEKRKSFSSLGITTILTLVAITLIVMNMNIGIVDTTLVLVLMGFFIGGGLWWIDSSVKKSNKKRYESDCTKRNGILKTDRITIAKDKVIADIQWELFETIIELDEMIVIVKDKEYLGFARYMFDSQTDWAHAKELIKNKFVQQSAALDAK
ncbi:MAG: hypothetical protein ACFFDN_51835 [Candidatus Hodarchaeota archaeon]